MGLGLAFLLEDLAREHIAEGAGLPPIRLHDLRHTAASLALQAGVPMKVVSEQLGQMAIGFSAGDYLPDLITFVRTTKVATLLRTTAAEALAEPAYLQAQKRVFELGYLAIKAR